MTIFSVIGNDRVGVRAVDFEVRLIRLDLLSGYSNSSAVQTWRSSASTMSGGSVFTPRPLREGAPAASAQARVGTGVVHSGTTVVIAVAVVSAATGNPGFLGVGSGTYEYPQDTTLSPGSSVVLTGGGDLVTIALTFEELRLGWSY